MFNRWFSPLTEGTSYIFSPIKNFLIGSADEFFLRDKKIDALLKEEVPGVYSADFGVFGVVYQIDFPYFDAPQEELARFLNELDAEPNGRKAYQGLNWIIDGTQLLTETGAHAMKTRALITRYFSRTNVIAENCRNLTRQALAAGPGFSYESIVYDVISQLFFNGRNAPHETHEFIPAFEDAITTKSALTPDWLRLFTKQNSTRKNYKKFYKKFIENEIQHIMETLRSSETIQLGKNLLLDLLVQTIEEKNLVAKNDLPAIREYLLGHPDEMIALCDGSAEIRGLPSIYLAADNIAKLTQHVDAHISSNTSLSLSVCNEYYALCDKAPHHSISTAQLLRLDALQRLYLEIQEKYLGNTTSVQRYAEKSMTITNKNKQMLIFPRNSFFLFKLTPSEFPSMKSNERHIAFSTDKHKRKCPGFKIAGIIFKSIAIELILKSQKRFTSTPCTFHH